MCNSNICSFFFQNKSELRFCPKSLEIQSFSGSQLLAIEYWCFNIILGYEMMINKEVTVITYKQGYIFLPKIEIFPWFTQNFSEIFNHKNWIYLVIFLSLWVFNFQKAKFFRKTSQISNLFRDDYHRINRNIYPWYLILIYNT